DRQMAQTGDNLSQEFEPLAGKIGGLGRQAGDVAARSRQAGTRPGPTGSFAAANPIGITDVTSFAASTAPPTVTITSTLSRPNSAAISPNRSGLPSAHRYSIARGRPSTRPSSPSR